MNKQELLELANIGKTEINGFPLEVKVYPSSFDGTPWIEIEVEPLSPLHLPLILGQKWVEYVTDEECEELPKALEEYKRQADEFCEKAKTIVKATLNANGTYTLIDDKASRKHPYSIRFIGHDKEYWYAPDVYTLELNGKQYTPHWSYWLNCAYYEADDQIKSLFKENTI
jgi:hypothetical protein